MVDKKKVGVKSAAKAVAAKATPSEKPKLKPARRAPHVAGPLWPTGGGGACGVEPRGAAKLEALPKLEASPKLEAVALRAVEGRSPCIARSFAGD